jgi:hypothetical protein
MPGSEITDVEWVDDLVRVRLKGSKEVHIEALIDPDLDTLRRLEVWREGPDMASKEEVLLRVEIPDLMHVGRHRLPEEMTIALPLLGWGLELEVHTWDELGVIPDVFELNPPVGAEVLDLVETVRSLAESQGVHPPE